MRRLIMAVVGGLAGLGATGCVVGSDQDKRDAGSSAYAAARDGYAAAIDQVLDALHDAAARADEARYFALFADDAVFLGTDATERWSKDQFRAYAHPLFAQGKGWAYSKVTRNIFVADDGRFAWFDETTSNAKLGDCRGTGVLVRRGERWKIAQYNLTIPIPNELAEDVVRQIQIRARPVSPAVGG